MSDSSARSPTSRGCSTSRRNGSRATGIRDVSPGDTLTLVWGDEFDAAQLDPEVWFFENGDGSQYGIPGWGNNELQWYMPDSAELSNGMLVITAREEFSAQMMNTLNDGAAKLTEADMNEEGANMLMLQTRQALGTTSLSLASQAAQSVLRLF